MTTRKLAAFEAGTPFLREEQEVDYGTAVTGCVSTDLEKGGASSERG